MIDTIRQRPHGTKLFMSIYQPKTLMAGLVNDPSIEKGDVDVAVDNISSGSVSNIYSGTTMLVGSQEGWDDVGRIRVRTVSGSVVGVAENAIAWQDNLFLTAIDQIDVEAIYPKIIQDPNDDENVIFLKDLNIEYSNQNEIFGSLICMGDHYAGFLENGTASVYYTATGTINVNGDSNTYLWSFEGGTPTGSTAHTPGFVDYDTAGHYVTKFTVTSDQGAVDVSYRYISIYDRPENGTNVPILDWSMGSLSGSRSESGYTVSVTVREQIDQVQPNAIVVLFADEFYGSTDGSQGGKPNRESIKFVGHILEDTIEYDYRAGVVTFQVASISELMKQADGFSVSCESVANPSTWFQIQDMSILKAIYHYLKWHSTVNLVADFQFMGDDRKHQYFDADRTSLYDAIYSFMRDGLKGNLVCDRQGKLWAEIDPEGLTDPLSYPVVMNILKQDWVGTPQVRERRSAQTSFIELNGIAFSGVSTGTFSALLSNAPSETPLYRGKPKTEKGLILLSQEQINILSGNYLAMQNSRFFEIDLSMNGNYSNLDIAPVSLVKPFIAPEDTPRNISISNESYLIERMDWQYESIGGLLRPDITIRHVTTGSAGVTITIPDVPDDGGFSVPNFQIPPPPSLFFPELSPLNSGSIAQIVNTQIKIIGIMDYAEIRYTLAEGTITNSRGITAVNGFTSPTISPVSCTATLSRSGLYCVSMFVNGSTPSSGDTIEAIIIKNPTTTIADARETSDGAAVSSHACASINAIRLDAGDVIRGQAQWAVSGSPPFPNGQIIFGITRLSE